MKKILFLLSLLLLCILTCTACIQRPGTINSIPETAPETVSEGTDTKCEVSYAPYTGTNGAMFLAEGDKVAVISPSALPTRKQVDAVIDGLVKWGYIPVEGAHVCEKERTLQECLDDLTWALKDPEIRAIFCVRGGYGASEAADILPLETIASAKKLIIGYSDITIYHAAWTTAGLPSIHASMSAAFTGLPAVCLEAEQKILQGEIPVYVCESSSQCREGEAEGILIGGNLSVFTSVLETAYDCTKTGQPYILFLEDVEEDMMHIHLYLTLLKHLGVLERAAGLIFGEWTDMPADQGDYDGDYRGGKFASVADMIQREILEGYDKPVAFGFPAGHGDVNYPLLMGEKAKLSVTKERYTLSWND